MEASGAGIRGGCEGAGAGGARAYVCVWACLCLCVCVCVCVCVYVHAHAQKLTDDDDVVVEDESFDGKCTISGTLMTEPMKNDQCPHVFDKKSIDMLLKKKPVIKCPMIGMRSGGRAAPAPRHTPRAARSLLADPPARAFFAMRFDVAAHQGNEGTQGYTSARL